MARDQFGNACLVQKSAHLAGELIGMHGSTPPGDEQQR